MYAGTFGKVNGINYVIKLAQKLININPEIIFVLVGDGIEKELVIQEASHKKILNKNVYILIQFLNLIYLNCTLSVIWVVHL